jgi:hypothetical protein
MEMGFRVFFLEESGYLRPIPWATFVGLYFNFPSIRFPEYAGQAIKSIHTVVELEDRAPVQILESLFFITHFDRNGAMDPAKKAERQQLAITMARTPPEAEQLPKGVIDLKPRLSEKQYDHNFRWYPTENEADGYLHRIEELLGI